MGGKCGEKRGDILGGERLQSCCHCSLWAGGCGPRAHPHEWGYVHTRLPRFLWGSWEPCGHRKMGDSSLVPPRKR